ncbi:MAG: hypothetical protein IKC86_01870 [Prevotella sp.]|nr:hypothetical protein [Prevotella sp.]
MLQGSRRKFTGGSVKFRKAAITLTARLLRAAIRRRRGSPGQQAQQSSTPASP